ncbi:MULTISPECIES: TetR/AcrR family transcriptional regulator [unclassified Methylobacterium]|uniref:TetR/AcrR family transcriptional regulator n=1 Tax=unclassified Methylobacterium TaxID=2615210 RepID=UPI002484B20B|nr:TetR/AcrR family transcriptional regulator [Methylobacterium sp. 2A]
MLFVDRKKIGGAMAGRPREFDRNVALVRAQRAFWTRGYEGTSMADLVNALGIASARIYAAFGSKVALFREAVEHYEAGAGGFATRALAEELTARQAIERLLREAVELYTRGDGPKGCMVVAAATNCAAENDAVADWLAERRRLRTASIVERLERAVTEGELPSSSDAAALGDHYAALLHGLSVQARDGVPRERLLALIPPALTLLGPTTPDPI